MNSLEKMLSLLDVFTPSAPVWSAEDLIRYSGCSRSTCYRYIKTLQVAGFVAPVGTGSYILGPRFIEFDRQIRLCDPVYTAGGPPLQKLSEKTGCSALLCVLFSDMVMCVRDELRPKAPEALFGRGQKRTLFVGAASKVILAFLPVHQLRGLYSKHRKPIAAAGLGADWEGFRKALRKIREDGYCVTSGEFNPGVVGVSAPLFNRHGSVLGSLGIALQASDSPRGEWAMYAQNVVAAAAETTKRIAQSDHGVDLPARAIG